MLVEVLPRSDGLTAVAVVLRLTGKVVGAVPTDVERVQAGLSGVEQSVTAVRGGNTKGDEIRAICGKCKC